MKGTRERGIACHLIHLQRHFKSTRISEHKQEKCNENPMALDVVVLGNCGSGKYCTARKIDRTLPWMIGNKGIDGSKAWPSLLRRSLCILDDSIG